MDNKTQHHLARRQDIAAMRLYNARFDNRVYTRATINRNATYSNALIDDAMAICGHPSFALSWRHWSPEAIAFLSLFAQE